MANRFDAAMATRMFFDRLDDSDDVDENKSHNSLDHSLTNASSHECIQFDYNKIQ